MTKPIAVIAGDYQQYRNFLREAKLTEKEAPFIDRPEKAMGIEFSDVRTVGTFWKLKDCDYIEQLVHSRIR